MAEQCTGSAMWRRCTVAGPVGGVVRYGDEGLRRADQMGDLTGEGGQALAHRRDQHHVGADLGQSVYCLRVEQIPADREDQVPPFGGDVHPHLGPALGLDVLPDRLFRRRMLVVNQRAVVSTDPGQGGVAAAWR